MFNVTYETITPESAEHADVADQGFVREHVSLREALLAVGFSPRDRGGFEDNGSWFSTIDPARDYSDGSETYYAIHPDDNITSASYARVRRVLCGRHA